MRNGSNEKIRRTARPGNRPGSGGRRIGRYTPQPLGLLSAVSPVSVATATASAAAVVSAMRHIAIVIAAMTVVPVAVVSAIRSVARITGRSATAVGGDGDRGCFFAAAIAIRAIVEAITTVVPIPSIVAATVLMTDVGVPMAVPSAVACAMAVASAALGLGSRRAEQQGQTQHKTTGGRNANET
jgi:hypothetical protein